MATAYCNACGQLKAPLASTSGSPLQPQAVPQALPRMQPHTHLWSGRGLLPEYRLQASRLRQACMLRAASDSEVVTMPSRPTPPAPEAQEEAQAKPAPIPEEPATPSSSSPKPSARDSADSTDKWQSAAELLASGEVFSTTIRECNKGGVLVHAFPGLNGFIPYSMMDAKRLPPKPPGDQDANLAALREALVGQPISCKAVQVDLAAKKFVLSERAALRSAAVAKLAPGQVVRGVVARLVDYGAFVTVYDEEGNKSDFEGLVHNSELSWNKVITPESVVKPGDEVQCKVRRVDPTLGRLELSLKRLEKDPLQETIESVLPIDFSSQEGLTEVAVEVPSGVEDICTALMSEPGITSVALGRQALEKRAVSQDLELWLSRDAVEDGFNLVARAGRVLQEVHVKTGLSSDDMKATIGRVLKRLV